MSPMAPGLGIYTLHSFLKQRVEVSISYQTPSSNHQYGHLILKSSTPILVRDHCRIKQRNKTSWVLLTPDAVDAENERRFDWSAG